MRLTREQRESLVIWFASIVSGMMSDADDDQVRVKNALKILTGDSLDVYASYDAASKLIGSEIRFIFDSSGRGIVAAHISAEQEANAKSYLQQLCKLAQTIDLARLGDIMARADQALPQLVAETLSPAPTAPPADFVKASTSFGVAAPAPAVAPVVPAAPPRGLPLGEGARSATKLPVLVAIREGSRTATAFKALMYGNSDSGKTNFLLRLCDRGFSPTFITTVGIDFKYFTLSTAAGPVKFHIWDSAGQERFRAISHSYLLGTDCVFVMVNPDISPQHAFETANTLREELQRSVPDHNLYSILYDGAELHLEPYTPENLEIACHNPAPAPHNLGEVGEALLTEVTRHFDLRSAAAVSAPARAPDSRPTTFLRSVAAFFGMGGSGGAAASSTPAARPPVFRR